MRMAVKSQKQYSPEDIRSLAERLRKGEDVRIELIEAHYPIVMKLVGFYTRVYPFRKDDIQCEAFYSLVKTISEARTKLIDDNITFYVIPKVKGAIRHYCVRDHLIMLPAHVVRGMQEIEDFGTFFTRTSNENNPQHLVVHQEGNLPNLPVFLTYGAGNRELEIPCEDKPKETVEDLYAKMDLTAEETRVCNYRLEGFNLKEIGQRVGCSDVMVWKIIQKIKDKILRLNLKNPSYLLKSNVKKTCTKCGIDKSVSEFHRIGDGLYKSICKQCNKEQYASKTQSIR